MRVWILIERAILPAFFALAGVASLIYGAAFHTAPVTEEQEIEETIEIPSAFSPPPGFAEGSEFGAPDPMGGDPFAPPPMVTKVKRSIFVTADAAEPTLVWEITIGGLVRLETGELKRTYSGAPSLCPS